jgi:serine/threonine protein phosphatase PrpC
VTVLRAAAETHTGYVRAINQDQAVVSGDLVAVADGMGGHLGGEVAARTAIEELVAAFRKDRTQGGLLSAVKRANRAIWRRSRVDRKLQGMGTTLTAVALVPEALVETGEMGAAGATGSGAGSGPAEATATRLVLVNIGDSRGYRLADDGRSLEQLTEDHTVVEEMVRHGDLSAAEASVHPHRHVLTRALGIDPDVEPDVWDLSAVPGSRLLLCSDGLTNELSDEEIAAVLSSENDASKAAQELVGRALGHGGTDNVTVVVVDVVEGDDAAGQPVLLVPARAADVSSAIDDARDITQALPVSPPTTADRAGSADAAGSAGPRHLAETGAATVALSAADLAVGAGGAAADTAGSARPGGRSLTVRDGEASQSSSAGPGAAGLAAGSNDQANGQSPAPTQFHRPVVLVPEKGPRAALRDRVLTPRVAVFVLLVLAVIGGAVGTVIWFNQSSFFVGLDGSRVAIYQGRPGGMLWFKPQLIETSRLASREVGPATRSQLRSGISESSVAAARQLVSYLAHEHSLLAFGTTPGPTLPGTTAPPSTAYTPPSTLAPSTSAAAPSTTTSTSPGNATSTTTTSSTTTSSTTTPKG